MQELFFYMAAAGGGLIGIRYLADKAVEKLFRINQNFKENKNIDYQLITGNWIYSDLARLAQNHTIIGVPPSEFYDESMQGIPPAFNSTGKDIDEAFRNCPTDAETAYSKLEELTQKYITEASS